MAISRKNGLAMAAAVFFVLSLQGVASRAKSPCENLLAPTDNRSHAECFLSSFFT